MSRIRKRLILERAEPVSEYVSEIAEALGTVTAAVCQFAAGMHTTSKGDQRDFAAVLYADAKSKFADVDRKLTEKQRADLQNYITALCKPKK